MNFSSLKEEILKNKENHNTGYFNCLPFMGMNRLEKYIPGVEQATYFKIVANSGVGKSKLMRFLFIHSPLMYVEQNPELGIKLDIFYFSLEESRSKIIKSEICKYIHTKYGITISVKQLSSVGRYNTIPSEYFPMIEEAEQHVNDFLSKVHIIDTVRNATGIYKKVRDHALNIGTYYDKNGVPLSAQEMSNVRNGIGEDFKKVSYYKKHNDRHYVIIIVDHLSLLEPEKGESLHSTMGLMSSKYFLHFRDKFGFTPVSVQQLTSAKEAIEVNFQGKTIEEKLEPSLDALANNWGRLL
jgi:hypothetical protein